MQFDLNLNANSAQRIEVVGQFIKYKSGRGAIRVTTSAGDYIDMTPGQAVYGVPFTGLSVADRSGAANPGVLLAGAFDFRDDTITGAVAMIEPYVSVLTDKTAYLGYSNGTTTAGVQNMTGIYNPVGSGKNIAITRIGYSTGGNAGLVSLYMIPASGGYVPPNQALGAQNMNVGQGAAAVSRMFTDDTGVQPSGWVRVAGNPSEPSGTILDFKIVKPIVLTPGNAIALFPAGLGEQVAMSVEFLEVPV
jgi:hypothetical protein